MEGQEKEHKHKNRLKGLFSKEKKTTPEGNVDNLVRGPSEKLHFQAPRSLPPTSSQEVDEFLHGPSDKLTFATPSPTSTSHPPPLARIDTDSARRWPSAVNVHSSQRPRARSTSPKRSKKGLAVRFTDDVPVVIGEGGDEAELPTISLRERAHSHPPGRPRSRDNPARGHGGAPPPTRRQSPPDGPGIHPTFRPGLLKRAPTGFETIPTAQDKHTRQGPPLPQEEPETNAEQNGYLRRESHDRKSFAARARAERRAGEGLALVQALSNPPKARDKLSLTHEPSEKSPVNSDPLAESIEQINQKDDIDNEARADEPWVVNEPPMKLELPDYSPKNFMNHLGALGFNTTQNKPFPPSQPSDNPDLSRAPSIPTQLTPWPGPTNQGTQKTNFASKCESQEPISRTSNLTLHGAAVAVEEDALQDFSTRVVHLFNIFLLSAESKRPISKCSFEDFVRAALWWFLRGRLLLEYTIRERHESPEDQQTSNIIRQQAYTDLAKSFWIIETITPQCPELSVQQLDPNVIDILETSRSIMSSLRKLTMSMKRNNFLPSEDLAFQQGLDTSIWVQDDGNRSLLVSQKQPVLPNLDDYFPLGDTNRSFHYGRAFAGAVLIEDADSKSQEYRCPVLISVIRGHAQTALTAIIASQDGMLRLCVQADKSLGPTWDNVVWNSKANILDIRLPRGFLLRLKCSYQDFKMLKGIYDYQRKTHHGLVRQQDEELVFETFLNNFQYFDPDPSSTLPKELLSNCRLRLFEKTLVEKAASGARGVHKGFRIAMVTSPTAKNLRGINEDLLPIFPIQFDFLRGEGGLPALLLRINKEKTNFAVVFTFENDNERTQMHARFTGVSLGNREAVVMESELIGFHIASLGLPADEKIALETLAWQSLRVVNEEQDDHHGPKTILSPNLRVIMDFRGGSITDRVNIGPGELKIRLDVSNSNEIRVLRQPQQDMTISISESQVSKKIPKEITKLLGTIATSESTRVYNFANLPELHLFQAALTGFSVLFDGVASSFNISRRRMVVPIYKKWDAATTRIQLVQREKTVQLVAFFANFSHGECMNFSLKSTDVFETSGRHPKQTVRIVDAKFPMPKARESGPDASFVCLDMLDYPGEHDDITIAFQRESDYEKFASALPAPVKTASRMPSVRR